MSEEIKEKVNFDYTLAEAIAAQAAEGRIIEKDKQKTYRLAIVCLSLMLIVSIICGTVIAVRTIIEQQYAMNAQFSDLYDLLAGAEVVTYEADSDGEGTAVAGDGNITVGGDYNG